MFSLSKQVLAVCEWPWLLSTKWFGFKSIQVFCFSRRTEVLFSEADNIQMLKELPETKAPDLRETNVKTDVSVREKKTGF